MGLILCYKGYDVLLEHPNTVVIYTEKKYPRRENEKEGKFIGFFPAPRKVFVHLFRYYGYKINHVCNIEINNKFYSNKKDFHEYILILYGIHKLPFGSKFFSSYVDLLEDWWMKGAKSKEGLNNVISCLRPIECYIPTIELYIENLKKHYGIDINI